MVLLQRRRLSEHYLEFWGNMKGKHSWGKHEIIGLSLFHSVHGPQLRGIVSKYESLESYCRFGLSKPMFHGNTRNLQDEIHNLGYRHLSQHAEKEIQLITFNCEEYPSDLLHIDYPPSILYVRGKLNSEHTIGIVGTRVPTPYGQRAAEHFAESLALNGICIASGLAPGIDTIVHKTVVKFKRLTYAVIASGHEQISPKLASDLSNEILASNGAVISEYSMNTKAKPPFFPRRNRIISGLSKSVVIIESGKKGGSMITAQFAFDQNKDVYVVPGSIYSAMSEGNHHLLMRDKGMIVTNPEELLYDTKRQSKKQNTLHECNVEEHAILQILNSEPLHIDEIVAKSMIHRPRTLTCLLNMECRSLVKQLSGMNFIRLTNEFTLAKKT